MAGSTVYCHYSRRGELTNLSAIFFHEIHVSFRLFSLQIMFSVTGLEFSFTQAPESMKSVLQACWLLTVAFGNIFVVIIAELKFFNSQASEFLLFFALMAVDVVIFIILAMRYVYRPKSTVEDGDGQPTNDGTSAMPMGTNKSRSGIVNTAYASDT